MRCNPKATTLVEFLIRRAVRPYDEAFTFFLGVQFGIGFAEQTVSDSPAQPVYNPSCFHKLPRNASYVG